jgi:hypothetical protein
MTIYTKYNTSSSTGYEKITTSSNVFVDGGKVTKSSFTALNAASEFKIDGSGVKIISDDDESHTKEMTALDESIIMIDSNGHLVVYSKKFANLATLFVSM